MLRCMGCMSEYFTGNDVCPHCGYKRGAAAREAFHLAPESILAGKYIVGRVLGFGGFGVTYIGYDAQLERVVAIKEFFPTSFATRMPGNVGITVFEGKATEQFGFGLERFIDEAKRLARFNGIEGITDIYDTFIENNTAYIIMEFLKGRDIKQLLNESGQIGYETARDIIIKICDTLTPVHAEGIIHRDISPDNIYFLDNGDIKLLDFGAARYESSANSKSLSVILKSGYAPEEQYRAKGDQGSWTDVYALAATFYKMLTGITPPDSMERAINDEIKEPSKHGVKLPVTAENAIMNALNVKKSYRTQTVQEFKNQLLSDGVVRTKVKQGQGRSGKMPIGGRIAVVVAGITIVALVALQLTGVLNVTPTTIEVDSSSASATGSEAAVQPQSSSAVDAANLATVPYVVGMQQEEAVATLEELGFVVEFFEPEFNSDLPLGEVTIQGVHSGTEYEIGKSILLKINGGGINDIVGLPAAEAAYILYNLAEYQVEYVHEFNDTVPAGHVVDFVFDVDMDYHVTVIVSAGPEAEYVDSGGMNITSPVLVLQSELFDNADRYTASVYAGYIDSSSEQLQYSPNGVDWYKTASNGSGGLFSNNYIEGRDTDYSILDYEYRYLNDSFFEYLFELLPQQTDSGTIHLRIADVRDDGVHSSYELPQKVTYNVIDHEQFNVTGQYLSWEDVDAMSSSGEIPEYLANVDAETRAQSTTIKFEYNNIPGYVIEIDSSAPSSTTEGVTGSRTDLDFSGTDYGRIRNEPWISVVRMYSMTFLDNGNTVHIELTRPIPLESIIVE